MTTRDALIEAGRRRLRPILMTTLTTVLCLMLPALGIGEGSVAQAQLARAVARGLTVSRLIDYLDPDPALGAFWEEPFSKDKPPAQ